MTPYYFFVKLNFQPFFPIIFVYSAMKGQQFCTPLNYFQQKDSKYIFGCFASLSFLLYDWSIR